MFKLKKAVKVCLAKNEWNMDDLAKSLCKPKATVNSALYNGNPTLATLNDMAKEFKLTLSEFIALGEE
jgi:hypothetical protein